ncbi:MAG TPA: chemotaxis protein CheC [Myxococcaceae bacterium]|nr:chemotaxis protein CheC [Myxococcaceae bacterium]
MPAELTEAQADALRELTNVAAGHAARALSTLLGGEKFGLWPPLVRLLDHAQLTALLGGRGAKLTSVSAELRGDVGGALALVFTEPHVQTLTSRLLVAAGQRFQTPEVALRDAANLVFAAALDAVTRLCGVRALHSVPVVGEGPAEMISRICVSDPRGWVLEAEIYASPLSGRFLLLPDDKGLSTFLRSLKMA